MATAVARPGIAARAAAFFAAIPGYLREVMAELKRVTWPDVPQVRQATIAIIVFVLIVSALIALMDVTLQLILVRGIPSLFAS
ncbi:MAG TPA: preprotein translocase subunit SecE [Gemmatimonadaceae bacterium]|nr:preprotein translocase subunit SecE [Gemmatimonadaceae bacterium]